MPVTPARTLLDSAGLTPDEVTLLARHLFDGESQTAIALADDLKQTTVSHRVKVAIGKLARVGLEVIQPGRGRARNAVHAMVCEPDAIDRIIVSGDAPSRGGRVVSGRWTDSHQ